MNARTAQLEIEILEAEKYLRQVKFVQMNHPHRFEDWNWIIEKHETILKDLQERLQEEMLNEMELANA